MVASRLLAVSGAIALAAFCFADGEQQFAEIGNLSLTSGKTINGCRVGFRTFGKLNAAKDNAVLVPTWFLGTTNDLKGSFNPGGLVDSTHYYVIAVDALGNGVSTSPSNSKSQHDAAFPAITIRDMVESQHKMLRGMGIRHLHAVLGISMGGFQSFQWLTAYPRFMDCVVPIVGSPRPTSYDLMFCAACLQGVRSAIAQPTARKALIKTYADFFWLALNTPTYYVKNTKREDAVASLGGFEKALLAWDPYDMESGLVALGGQDIFKAFGGSESQTAAAVRARVFVAVAQQDHCVNPAPALSFAKALGAETMVFPDDQGHSSPGAEMARLSPAIDRFLGRQP
jgi:homoserine O-acetyltransferase